MAERIDFADAGIMRSVFLALVTTFILPVAVAEDLSGTLAGTVVGFTGKAVKKVKVMLTSPDDPSFTAEALTDKNGSFTILLDDATSSYVAHLEKRGYAVMENVVNIRPGQTNERTFTVLTVQEVMDGKDEILRERELANTTLEHDIELYNEGVAALAAGYPDTARDRFQAALEINEHLAPALSGMSLIAFQRVRLDEAASFAARTLALVPDDPVALFVAYRANKALGREEQAAAALTGLVSTGGSVDAAAQVFNEGADAYRAQDFEHAERLFSEALELDPNLPNAYAALAAIHLAGGEYGYALEDAGKALELQPDNTVGLKIRFEASLAGNSEELATAMEGYTAVDADHVYQVVNERAFGFFKENNYDEARRLVNLVLRLNWDEPRANHILGLILVNAGDNRAAREYLEKFIELAPEGDPDVEGARKLLEELE